MREGDINKIRMVVLENHQNHFWQFSNIYFFPDTKIITQLDTDKNRSNLANRLNLAEEWIYMSENDLG